jgi:hypothetical protein
VLADVEGIVIPVTAVGVELEDGGCEWLKGDGINLVA